MLREEHQVKAKTGESKLEYNWEGERGGERVSESETEFEWEAGSH